MRVLAGDRKKGAISRFITITLILLFVVLVALWFAARTDGGRSFAESKLSDHFGVKVSIESMRIGFPYALVLKDLRTAEFEAAGTAGFSVAEVRLGRGFRYWHLRLKQLIVRVQDDGSGGWKPDSIARLGDLKDAEIVDMVQLTDALRKKMRLRVVNSNLDWLDEDGVEIASARDVDFRMLPVKIDDRKMHYYVLNIYNAKNIILDEGRDMHWEWLTTPKTDYIELPSRNEDMDEYDEEYECEEIDECEEDQEFVESTSDVEESSEETVVVEEEQQ